MRRTEVGPFTLAEAHTLADLEERLVTIGLTDLARRCFPVRELSPEQAQAVTFGRPLELDLVEAGPVAVLDENGGFLALYQQRDDLARPLAVFS